MSPQVRRWSTLETVTVAVPRGHSGERVELIRRQVRVWHRELVVDHAAPGRVCRCGQVHTPTQHGHAHTPRRPLLVADNDQLGIVPPAEWVDLWVRRWRRELGHPVPARTRTGGTARLAGRAAPLILPAHPDPAVVPADSDGRLADAAVCEAMLMGCHQPAVLPAVAAYLTVRRAYIAARNDAQSRIAAATLGVDDDGAAWRLRAAQATAGAVRHRPADALSAQWALRYGVAAVAAHVAVDAGYLADWLPAAAECDTAGVGEFLVELRALVGELEHAVGESTDNQWIGRCPAELYDADGAPSGRMCGYGLWQDPYRTRVECPRCHSTWAEREWLALAVRILTKWPVDRRRLYTLDDRTYAEKQTDRIPLCRGCERPMAIQWREVPARGRPERMWRQTGLACRSGCLASGAQAAA